MTQSTSGESMTSFQKASRVNPAESEYLQSNLLCATTVKPVILLEVQVWPKPVLTGAGHPGLAYKEGQGREAPTPLCS